MAPVRALLFCYRLPSLTDEQFRAYIEDKHCPLVRSLLGSDYPASHERYYTAKDSGYAIGTVSGDDPDMLAVVTYESKEAMQKSMHLRMSDGIRQQIQADEDKFMLRERIKLVLLS